MPEALTESYCERCGTRYEFAAPAKMTPTRRARGLMAGFKNYVMSQESLSDSLADAARQQEEELASKQLDAFHSSFNFCIDCRQYTCVNCWNDAAGRCQSCQPLPAALPLADRFAATLGDVEPDYAMQFPLDQAAWPSLDLQEPRPEPKWPELAPAPPMAEVEPEPIWVPEPEPVLVEAETEPIAEAEPEPAPVLVEVQAEPEPVVEPVLVEAETKPEPVVVPEPIWVPEPQPAPVLVEAQAEPEPVVEPVLVEAQAAPEPVVVPEPIWVPEPQPEPVLAEAQAEPEPVAAPEPEPVLVEADAEPEPEALPEPTQLPYRPLRPISDTFLHFPNAAGKDEVPAAAAAAAAADRETLAARRAQLDLLGLGDTGQGPVGPSKRVVLPYRSSGAAPRGADLQGTPSATAGGAFWDASAREVAGAISQIGVRTCGHCELSLSASARFCRRCGTPQSQSA
jgi:hypothetical protein